MADFTETSRFEYVRMSWSGGEIASLRAKDSLGTKKTFDPIGTDHWRPVTEGNLKILRDMYASDAGILDADGNKLAVRLTGCPYTSDEAELESLGFIHPLIDDSHKRIVGKKRLASGLPYAVSVFYSKGATSQEGPMRRNVETGESRDRFYRIVWNTEAQRTENGGVAGITFAATADGADQIAAAGETAAISVADHFMTLPEGEYDILFGGGIGASSEADEQRNRMRLHKVIAGDVSDEIVWRAACTANRHATTDPWSVNSTIRCWGETIAHAIKVPSGGATFYYTHSGAGRFNGYGKDLSRGYSAYMSIRKTA